MEQKAKGKDRSVKNTQQKRGTKLKRQKKGRPKLQKIYNKSMEMQTIQVNSKYGDVPG